MAEEAGGRLVRGVRGLARKGGTVDVREVAGGCFVFGLLFSQEAGQGYNVGVYLFLGNC